MSKMLRYFEFGALFVLIVVTSQNVDANGGIDTLDSAVHLRRRQNQRVQQRRQQFDYYDYPRYETAADTQDTTFGGYSYPKPAIPFSYEEQRKKSQSESRLEREKLREERRRDERRRDRDRDERRRTDDRSTRRPDDRDKERENKAEEERRAEEKRLRDKEAELEERELRSRRLREELEQERKNTGKEQQERIDMLVQELRERTLMELERFGMGLKQNQALEDEARNGQFENAEKRVRITEEQQEIIRRPGQPPVTNTRTRERVETGQGAGGGTTRRVEEEVIRQTSRRTGGTDSPSGGGSSGESFSSRSSSSSSRSSSSGSSGSSALSGRGLASDVAVGLRSLDDKDDFDSDFAGSVFIPARSPKRRNDPLYLSVADSEDILLRTGAVKSLSTSYFS